jgi:hypothetical protein
VKSCGQVSSQHSVSERRRLERSLQPQSLREDQFLAENLIMESISQTCIGAMLGSRRTVTFNCLMRGLAQKMVAQSHCPGQDGRSLIQDENKTRAHHGQTHAKDEAAANDFGHGRFPRVCEAETGTRKSVLILSLMLSRLCSKADTFQPHSSRPSVPR